MLQLIHTSPERIEKIQPNYIWNEFQGALFFSSSDYYTTKASFVYEINVEEDQVIDVCDLEYNQSIIDEIKQRFDICFDKQIDDDEAYEYLTDDLNIWDELDYDDMQSLDSAPAVFSWFIQGVQAKAAKQQGFLAAHSEDEQGDVWIVNMINKEYLLKDVTAEFLEC